ncbi:PaaI family thioesterase [Sandaracinobacter sp. RS1-74]|uniref:PaaI family thioesterase n=1 Tax=Sandaracinobacteroides sayramensis TaxID=2913411 RepID=UPI001EDC406B|nr:PaaI family thioesterase [Sandaracinobacteroides sayramensis]MCG2841579.1 PaaI family thioesterase [Sandaracinobacteroides sayramensis]
MAGAPIEEGPWKGWRLWHPQPEGRFVDTLGEIHYRDEPPGVLAVIETGHRHSNYLGFLHGGFLMAFIDVAMFAAVRHLPGHTGAVTVQCATDFLGAGIVGKPLEGRGHIVRETGKLIWVAGTLTQDDGETLVCQWHGLLRKVQRRP